MAIHIHAVKLRQMLRWRPWLVAGVVGIVVVAGGWLLIGRGNSPAASAAKANVEATGDDPLTLQVPPEVMKSLRINTVDVKPYTLPRVLQLEGTLFADPSQIARVHSRFPGEVMSIGSALPGDAHSPPLRFGDSVKKDQLLAVVWCKDLGEKKSELVDSLLQLRMDEVTLARLQDLAQKGATSEQKVREAERARQADWIAYTRAVRTLQSWQLTDDEIKPIEKEADSIDDQKSAGKYRSDESWSRVEVRAPIDGEIAEINSGPHDIVDTSTDVMKIVDMSRLRVMCHIYEDDLRLLQELPANERYWKIHVDSSNGLPEADYTFDQIGNLIDPNQHTAEVMGWIPNPGGHLLLGQFVTATIQLPPPKNLVAVPAAAVVDTDAGTVVLVRNSEADGFHVEQRRVAVAQREHNIVGIVSEPTPEQLAKGIQPLKPQEQVIAGDALQLSSELANQSSASR
jgi:membrane fusion protein, heavy metal efflux system